MKNSPNRDPQQNTGPSRPDPGSIPLVLEPFDTHRARSTRRLAIAVLASVPCTLEFSKLVSEVLHIPENAHHQAPQALYLATLIVLAGYIPRLFNKRLARKMTGWSVSSGSFVSLGSPASPGSLGSRVPIHMSKPTLTTMMSRASGVYVTETGHSQNSTPGGLKDDHQGMQPSMPPDKPAGQLHRHPSEHVIFQAHNPESLHPNHNARNEEWSERQWLHLELLDDHPDHRGSSEPQKSVKSNGAQKPGNSNIRSTGQDHCATGDSTDDSISASGCDPAIKPPGYPLDRLAQFQRYEGNRRGKSGRGNKDKSTSTDPAQMNNDPETQAALENVETNALKLLRSIMRLAVSVAIRALRGLMK